jgi:hypothetical protein
MVTMVMEYECKGDLVGKSVGDGRRKGEGKEDQNFI